ncbi:DUF7266 family protein [Haloarchaeobius amylolyticus]|uniref:DUF7266 family protein n=1 Tax=Haloarchaeobius amylolyticus TaxID=1198296 RepID=UPI002271B574|nr:hypothetical protein [Haloarchaeobius amylolyticus]
MTPNLPLSDDRGVSIAVTHVLTIGITTILITGLLVGASGLLQDERADAARDEMRTIGNRMATDIASVDRAADGTSSTMSVRSVHPSSVSGSTYTVHLKPGSVCAVYSNPCLVLNATSTDTTVYVPFNTSTTVTETRVSGGDIYIVYDGSDIKLASEPANPKLQPPGLPSVEVRA